MWICVGHSPPHTSKTENTRARMHAGPPIFGGKVVTSNITNITCDNFSRKNWENAHACACMQVRKETAEIRKDTEELKSLGNKQSENINIVDTRLVLCVYEYIIVHM